MKCPLYKEHLYIHFVNPLPKEEVVSVCSWTKEEERCNCGGDIHKCDFCSETRENGGDIMVAYEILGDLIKEMLEKKKEELK